MKPGEFFASTPAEIFYMLEGFNERHFRYLESLAMQACWIINYTSQNLRKGQSIKPENLIKRKPKTKHFKTSEEAKAFADKLFAQHKLKEWTKVPEQFAPKNLKKNKEN